jgi:NhaP-type Na+/H+ or K+/H+ antiporter
MCAAIAGCLFGAFVGVVGVLVAKGAPQEASAAAIAVACAVIPYCLARAVSEIWEQNFS